VEFPKFAAQGHHPDPAYVGWFTRMLELTAPVGVVSAFGDWEAPKDRLITDFCKDGVVVRLPPVRSFTLLGQKQPIKKQMNTSSNTGG
jgi:hypothetical protein